MGSFSTQPTAQNMEILFNRLDRERSERLESEKQIRKEIKDLREITMMALENIDRALDEMQCPPDKEESPVLADLLERVKIIESNQRYMHEQMIKFEGLVRR